MTREYNTTHIIVHLRRNCYDCGYTVSFSVPHLEDDYFSSQPGPLVLWTWARTLPSKASMQNRRSLLGHLGTVTFRIHHKTIHYNRSRYGSALPLWASWMLQVVGLGGHRRLGFGTWGLDCRCSNAQHRRVNQRSSIIFATLQLLGHLDQLESLYWPSICFWFAWQIR